MRESPFERVSYEKLEEMRDRFSNGNIRTSFAKLFLDGVVPGHTASLIDPYLASSGYDLASHDPDSTLLITPEELNETVTELDRPIQFSHSFVQLLWSNQQGAVRIM